MGGSEASASGWASIGWSAHAAFGEGGDRCSQVDALLSLRHCWLPVAARAGGCLGYRRALVPGRTGTEQNSPLLKARRDTAVGAASYETLRLDRFSQPLELTA